MSPRPVFAQVFSLVLAVSPVFMGSGPPASILAILYGITGVLLILFPPKISIPKPLALASLALLAACSLSFLPADWFPVPSWRSAFQSQPDIHMGTLVTPQPWHTLEGLGMLLAGILLGFFFLSQPVGRREHRRLAAGFAIAIGAFASLAIFSVETGWMHPWDRYGTFGFLPNRNHTGTLLTMGAIVGFGSFWDAISRRRLVYIFPLALSLLMIFIAALNYNGSRAGAILIFIGLFLWMVGAFRKGVDRRIVISASVFLVLSIGIFLTSKTEVMKRFHKQKTKEDAALATSNTEAEQTPAAGFELPSEKKETNKEPPFDFRVLIYKDTLRMIGDQPFAGVGLGNFRYIFPQYRQKSANEFFCLHPESSWLELTAEAGVLAPLAAAALIVMLFLRLRGCSIYPGWNIRWASTVAVLMCLVHSFFDVPGHRTATVWPALFLAGLAFRIPSNETIPSKKPWATRCLFLLAGVLFLGASAWLWGFIPNMKGPTTIQAEEALKKGYALYQEKKEEEAMKLLEAAAQRTPLAHDLYFQWGSMELTFEDTDPIANDKLHCHVDRLYETERLLEPCFTYTAVQQGAMWLTQDPNRSLNLFSEALKRSKKQYFEKPRSEKKLKLFETPEAQTFANILRESSGVQDVVDRLLPLAENNPQLVIEWMNYASKGALNKATIALTGTDPTLAAWTNEERRLFFRLWHQRGEDEPLMRLLEAQPSLEAAGWPLLAGRLARQRKFQEAWSLIAMEIHLTDPALTEEKNNTGIFEIQRLRAWFSEQKTKSAALRLAKALYANGDYEELEQLGSESGEVSAQSKELFRLASMAAARINHWDSAWRYAVLSVKPVDQPE